GQSIVLNRQRRDEVEGVFSNPGMDFNDAGARMHAQSNASRFSGYKPFTKDRLEDNEHGKPREFIKTAGSLLF
ncbi:hypothetical protein AB4Z22_44305, partial [Paenibacillus sp. TAF58]